MSFAMFIDVFVAILLMVMIGYAVVLNKRLSNLRRDRGELERLAINFHASTSRADESIAHLRSSVEGLQEQVEKAQAMRDDLIFLTERGSSAADRLEEYIRLSRTDITAPAKEAAQLKQKVSQGFDHDQNLDNASDISKRTGLNADLKDRIDTEGVSEAEKELLKALRSAS
jgi:hypothetical protein